MKATLHTFDNVGDDEIEAIFNDVNVNHDHSINYNEFIAATMWKRIHLDEERLHQVPSTNRQQQPIREAHTKHDKKYMYKILRIFPCKTSQKRLPQINPKCSQHTHSMSVGV